MRDTGRQQAYRAERRVFETRPRILLTKDEAREISSAILGERWSSDPARLSFPSKSGTGSWAEGGNGWGRMRVGVDSRGMVRADVLLHETAHLLAPIGVQHGEPWRAEYVRLVREWIGEETAEALRRAFDTEPIRRPERGPRRRWRIMVRDDEGERTATAKEVSRMTPSYRAAMRRGIVWVRENVRTFARVEEVRRVARSRES